MLVTDLFQHFPWQFHTLTRKGGRGATLEGGGATMADGTGGDDDHVRRRVVEPRLRVVEEAEGRTKALETKERRRPRRRRNSGTGSAGWTTTGCRSLSQREDDDDAATVLLQC